MSETAGRTAFAARCHRAAVAAEEKLAAASRAGTGAEAAREAAEAYLDLPDDAPDAERIRLNAKLEKHRRKLPGLKQKHRDELIESETRYRDLLERARGEHEASSAS